MLKCSELKWSNTDNRWIWSNSVRFIFRISYFLFHVSDRKLCVAYNTLTIHHIQFTCYPFLRSATGFFTRISIRCTYKTCSTTRQCQKWLWTGSYVYLISVFHHYWYSTEHWTNHKKNVITFSLLYNLLTGCMVNSKSSYFHPSIYLSIYLFIN